MAADYKSREQKVLISISSHFIRVKIKILNSKPPPNQGGDQPEREFGNIHGSRITLKEYIYTSVYIAIYVIIK